MAMSPNTGAAERGHRPVRPVTTRHGDAVPCRAGCPVTNRWTNAFPHNPMEPAPSPRTS